jgi:hypothetical protein
MREQKRRRVVIAIAAAAIAALGIAGARNWELLYAELFLDRRLIGLWYLDFYRSSAVSDSVPSAIRFHATGRCELGEGSVDRGRYRIDGDSIVFDTAPSVDIGRDGHREAAYDLDGANGLLLRYGKTTAYYMRE